MRRAFPRLRFFAGVALIYTATNLWTTFLLWQMLRVTDSGLWLAAAVAAGALPIVLVGLTGPEWGIGGRASFWLAGIGVLLGVMAPWTAKGAVSLLIIALLEGWVTARLVPMSQAWLMSQVAPKDAPKASARYEIASRIGMVAGPILGGAILTAYGAIAAMALVSSIFLATGATWHRLPEEDSRKKESHPVGARFTEAWRAIRNDRFLGPALTVRAGANILWPAFTIAVPLLAVHPWHAHAIGYGLTKTLWGISTVLGTVLIVPRLIRRLKYAYFLSWLFTGLAFWGVGSSAELWSALLWIVAGALSSPIVHVALDSHIGTAIAPTHRGSVYAIQRQVVALVNLAGLALVSGAMKLLPPGQLLSGAGILMSFAALLGLVIWRQRPTAAPAAVNDSSGS
ncbi:MAG: MFS transporter [Firmicutes bacterium]|nr:MFS transporter [Bacillota bacterium]